MNIEYLVQLLNNRLNGLSLAKDQAFQAGDLERIIAVDAEILDVKNTLSKLSLIASIEQTAAATPFTEAQVVKNGINASLNANQDAAGSLQVFDITNYATDPLHEQKIATILSSFETLETEDQITAYIQKKAPGSPLNGKMILDSEVKFSVNRYLLLAIMELDSAYGTLGVGANTLNPGNVGNNDAGETQTFATWNDGVEAVAKWLDNHRKTI